MEPVIIKHGIIKSDRVDLTVLPCSGKLKRFEEEGDSNRVDIEWYGLPAPNDLEGKNFPRGPIGFISDLLVPTKHIGQSKYVVYATTSNGGSNIDALYEIGRRLGHATQENSTIRLIEAPFLGTGKGGLSVRTAVRALSRGFSETRHPHAVLRLRNFTASLVKEAEDALRPASKKIQKRANGSGLNLTPDNQSRATINKGNALLHFAAPKVFISYAWEDREHKQWVKELAVRLRVDGVEVILDQYELHPGDQLPEFMEKSVRTSDEVLIVCTPHLKKKSDARSGGVGYEGSVITAEVLSGTNRRKFIPLLRRGEWSDAAPAWLLGSVYLDFRHEGPQLEDSYSELLKTIHGRREAAPPVGSPPFPERHRQELPVVDNEPQSRSAEDGLRWPHVWNTLMNANPYDEHTANMGRRWLVENSADDPNWTSVWNTLMNANPHDEHIADLGRRWLVENSAENPEWASVWNTLMNANPHDEYIADLGRRWLLNR